VISPPIRPPPEAGFALLYPSDVPRPILSESLFVELLNNLKSLKRRDKLVLIAAAILLPVFLLCGVVVYSASGTIAETRRELAGTEYLRGAWTMIAACDNGRPVSADEFAPLPPTVKPVPTLETAQRALAQRLGTPSPGPDACDAARAYIRHVADDSHLALDPKPETYYLMLTMVDDVPTLSGRLTEIEADATAAPGTLADARARARQVTAATDAVRNTLGLAEAGGDGSLRTNLAQSLRNFSRALDEDVQAIEQGQPASTVSASTVPPAPIRAVQLAPPRRALRAALESIWGASSNQLERLLQHRLAMAQLQLWLTLGGALVLAAAAIGVVVYFDLYGEREQVMRLNRDLRQSYDELERFAYICSHDMQEPVRMMHLYAGMLMEDAHDVLDEISRRHLKLISDNAERMRKMISDILQFSRVGRDPVQTERVDCDTIAGEVLSDFSREIIAKAARVTRSPLPVVTSNPTLVRIVLQNLIGNALKFQDGLRTPEVDISAHEDGRMWRFEVRDNGIGIDPAGYDQVFAIFQRLHRQEEYPGSGVGLSTCRKFLSLAGGEIGYVSSPGKGTTFWFTLPRSGA